MENNYITLKCNSCGATLNINIDEDIVQCEYCDTKIILKNNEEIVRIRKQREIERRDKERHQRMIEAEDRKMKYEEKMKYLEMEMQRKAALPQKICMTVWVILTVILYVIGTIAADSEGDYAGLSICLLLAMSSVVILILYVAIHYKNFIVLFLTTLILLSIGVFGLEIDSMGLGMCFLLGLFSGIVLILYGLHKIRNFIDKIKYRNHQR